MESVAALILEAWERVHPKLLADPVERAKRVARRRLAVLNRPPRAWCIAIRASDTRLPGWADCRPGHALRLNHPDHPYRYAEHHVTLTARALRVLCAPVYIEPPGEPWTDVATKLGCHEETLRRAMNHGQFEVRHIKGLGGKRGKPIPLLYTRVSLDPSSSNFRQRPDPLWGAMWTHLATALPDDFEQTLVRHPIERPYACSAARRSSGIRRGVVDAVRFRGWHWECPGCKRRAKTLFYPMAPMKLTDAVAVDPITLRPRSISPRAQQRFAQQQHDGAGPDDVQAPPPCFACVSCHRVRYFSRVDRDSWNHLIAYLSGGLLYGFEVKKPDGYRSVRKREYHAHLLRAPSPRRQEVLALLLRGLPYRAIAAELGVGYPTVHGHVKSLYRQHHVHTRAELARHLGQAAPPRQESIKRTEVRRLLLAGEMYKTIARRMKLSYAAVAHHVKRIYREAKVSGRARLIAQQLQATGRDAVTAATSAPSTATP
jgi:DNA-binding NarL/FixJ family response regulator